jgi:hypothetical protein
LTDELGPADATIARSLIERATYSGLIVGGARADIHETVVRGTRPRPPDLAGGRGLAVRSDPMTLARSEASVRSCVIEGNSDMGMFVGGGDVTIESTLVRNTLPMASDQQFGRSLSIEWDPDTGARSMVAIQSSVFEGGHGVGVIVVSSDATIESTVVRNVAPLAADQSHGMGIGIERHLMADGANVSLRASLIEHTRVVGVTVLHSTATVESTLVRDTATLADGSFGDGITVLTATEGPAALDLRGARIETSARAGLSVFGANATVMSTAFECNTFALDLEEFVGFVGGIQDAGGNACGCNGNMVDCQAVSAQLAPPDASQ